MNVPRRRALFALYLAGALFFGSAPHGMAQTISHPAVVRGIEQFYAALFEQAVNTLETAIEQERLSADDLFGAHIYIAFSLIRQNAYPRTVRVHLIEAVTANPEIELDPVVIPPDLLSHFNAVRDSLIGGFMIYSDPLQATVLLVDPESGAVENRTTPALFENMWRGEYQAILSASGYRSHTVNVAVKAGETDTLLVILQKQETPVYKRWWAWGGGLALGAAIILSQTLGGGDDEPEPAANLPAPPDRPRACRP